MQHIIIIGNSGAAHECHQLFTDCWWHSPSFRFSTMFKGFLSYKGYVGNLGELSFLALGDMDTYELQPHDRFIIGIGNPALRCEIYTAMKKRGASFLNLISPWSYIPGDFKMGEGNIINSSCNFSCGSVIGNANYFNGGVRLGHDVHIGNFNFFGPSTTVLGGANVGDGNIIAVQSTLLERSHIGDHNHLHPASVIFKGCGNDCRMAGNPALKMADNEN